jgi:transposase-like protein
MGDTKESSIGNINAGTIRKGVVAPSPGQNGRYICGNCGERFTHKIPLLLDIGVKCPECGSFHVKRDPAVVY